MQSPVNALTIAGFDPSAGAGLTIDTRVMEFYSVYPLSVCTAVTVQNSKRFAEVKWIKRKTILKQLEILFEEFTVKYAKVGLIKNIKHLKTVVNFLYDKGVKIIWDPIIKSSTGFGFYKYAFEELLPIINKIYLITPNIEEAELIFGSCDKGKIQYILYENNIDTMVLLKGGHSGSQLSCDYLISKNNFQKYCSQRIPGAEKHGTGCVLSTSIMSNLVKGFSLNESITKAKNTINNFIKSSETKIGYFSNV